MNFELENAPMYVRTEVLPAWWKAWGWPAIGVDHLPETGLMVSHEGKPVCAGFLYKTDSKFAILEWVVGDPAADKSLRHMSVDILVQGLVDEAKRQGFKSVFSSIRHHRLLESYKKAGFMVTDEGMTNVIWRAP
jgi:hypothetical protein